MLYTNYAPENSLERQTVDKLYSKLTSKFNFDEDEFIYVNDNFEFKDAGKIMAKISALKPSSEKQNMVVVYTDRYADSLGDAFLKSLEEQYPNNSTSLTCFWNYISKPEGEDNLDFISYPVMKTYQEKFNPNNVNIVMVNPLLNHCDLVIIKQNLTRILTGTIPHQIFIVSPIINEQLLEELKKEFPEKIAKLILPVALLKGQNHFQFISKGNGDALTVRARRMEKEGLSSGQ